MVTIKLNIPIKGFQYAASHVYPERAAPNGKVHTVRTCTYLLLGSRGYHKKKRPKLDEVFGPKTPSGGSPQSSCGEGECAVYITQWDCTITRDLHGRTKSVAAGVRTKRAPRETISSPGETQPIEAGGVLGGRSY